MTFTREQVTKIADLARLQLTDAEIEEMAGTLTAILDYFEVLGSVDTEGVEPMAHPLPIQNVFREDECRPGLSTDEALANAPKRAGDFFSVPPILDT